MKNLKIKSLYELDLESEAESEAKTGQDTALLTFLGFADSYNTTEFFDLNQGFSLSINP